jgi:hypothetical protein
LAFFLFNCLVFDQEFKMKRSRSTRIDSYFKPGSSSGNGNGENTNAINSNDQHIEVQPIVEQTPVQGTRTAAQGAAPSLAEPEPEPARVVTTAFERDPGKRAQIKNLPPAEQDEALRFYISEGPYQPILADYPFKGPVEHRRRFNSGWFKEFWWLEYSPHTDRAYCLPCFLFSKKPSGRCGSDTFTVKGFQSWKKVNDGDKCSFLTHMGRDASSAHNYSVQCFNNLKNSMAHIDKVIVRQNEKIVADATLRISTTIDCLR